MKYLGLFVMVAIALTAAHVGGPIAVTRTFGIFWMLGSVWMAFAKEIPVSLGQTEVGRLRGWTKVFGVVPFFVAGSLMAVYAAEVTCWSTKYKHLCAAA
jgi:hypothetical protein